jgi:transglutaminase-like putative cysteine protease
MALLCMCVQHGSVNQKNTTVQRFTYFDVEAGDSYLYGKFITNQQLTLNRKIPVEENAENFLFANYQFTIKSISHYQQVLYHYIYIRRTVTSVNLAATERWQAILAIIHDRSTTRATQVLYARYNRKISDDNV